MIRINKPGTPPKILLDKQKEWTNELLQAISEYGSYSDIPKSEKEKLLHHYRHDEIKILLFQCSYDKCAFCECIPGEGGNIEVEHFAPKSIYHKLAFEWDNFLPVCRKCNEAKSNFDTLKEPIVNPTKEDPEEFFDFNLINIVPSSNPPNLKIALTTIKVCNLNSTRLFKARADLLYHLSIYQEELSNWLQEIDSADTDLKRKNRITKLINSIDAIDMLGMEEEKYSAFCKNFLFKSEIYNRAKKIISDFRQEEAS